MKRATMKRVVMSLTAQAVPDTQRVIGEETELEPLWRVIIHNDDVTTMDFVVYVLEKIFFISPPDAVSIMLAAHLQGQAYVQTLPKSEAQNRIGRAQFAAGMEGFPLRFSMEPE